jgi:hypothetical protein
LKQNEEVIQSVVGAVSDADVRQQLETVLPQMPAALATAIQPIWSGARDEAELCDELDYREGAIVVEILRRLSV